MTYAVHHLDGQGTPQLEEFPSLEAGLTRVEALRNDGAAEVRVFKEVPIEVRTYYRVVAVEDEVPEPPLPASPPEPELEAALPAAEEQPAPDAADGLWDAAADEARHEQHRVPVAQEPPSGAVVMGPAPVSVPRDASELPPEPTNEHRRSLFGRG